MIKACTDQSTDSEAEGAKAKERGCQRPRPQALRRPLKARPAPTSEGPRRAHSIPPPGEQRCRGAGRQPRARASKDAGGRRSRAAPVAGSCGQGRGTREVLREVRAMGRADGLREACRSRRRAARSFLWQRTFGESSNRWVLWPPC